MGDKGCDQGSRYPEKCLYGNVVTTKIDLLNGNRYRKNPLQYYSKYGVHCDADTNSRMNRVF